ncbi:HA2 [Nesidiocoris tenuis]|uniref:HA2 n=1 Tax=Nesidiocoris tenuis TaxID=355587 RepID=A0ABN7B3W1_9HEMI|nr:HA2 [Nesidiocoris tenuis]
MPRRTRAKAPDVGESFRICVDVTMRKFMESEDVKEWEYPNSLTAAERAYVHMEARKYNFKSKSRGKNSSRYLTVYKRDGSAIMQNDATINLTPGSRGSLLSLLAKHPVTPREKQDCLPPVERCKDVYQEGRESSRALGRLGGGKPEVPAHNCNKRLQSFRQSLPIFPLQETIVQTINDSQVTIITGQTGSGKSTQVPQYLVEWHERNKQKCRILVAEPRRISAVSLSERVALERGENVGQSVGYQIRLEGKSSPSTVLMYCTTGVLLRSFMAGEGMISSVTHIIIDEVHERDYLSDFLLIVLREALTKFRSLRLVLMSATVNAKQFSAYFNNCPIIPVPGKPFEVKEYFLEDVLKQTGFMNSRMESLRAEIEKQRAKAAALEKWTSSVVEGDGVETAETPAPTTSSNNDMDNALMAAWSNGSESSFAQILHLIFSENISVDYQHSETGVTPLMVAAARGSIETVEQLLYYGANINIKLSNDYRALDFAQKFTRTDVIETLEAYATNFEQNTTATNEVREVGYSRELSESDKELIDMYHATNSIEDKIDVNLLVTLILFIHNDTSNRGAILVFLPGYEDIIQVKEQLNIEKQRSSSQLNMSLWILHSNMQTSDQRMVFKAAAPNTRKVILSTNIAETCLTIEDVCFVIDSGKVKEKSYCASTGVSQLSTVWISQSCALQRKGRAGRVQSGVCYRIYSSLRYDSMQMYPTPEILRIPLQELCLFAKQLAPPNTSIVDFLSRAMDPPQSSVSRSAVALLKTIDALDTWEDLTDLGHHLLDLPVEPKYGKMLIYALVLKCLDPVLTIVCCLSYRDLFTIPTSLADKRKAAAAERAKFANGSLSDHMVLLRVFQCWQEAKKQGRERAFCNQNFVNGATMEIIMGTRAQVLAQLRACGFIKLKGQDIKYVNTNSENWAVIKAALIGGLYPNLARVDREHGVLRTVKEHKVKVHMTSVLAEGGRKKACVENLPSDWIMYEELTKIGRNPYIRTATVVSPITVAVFAGPSKIPYDALSDTHLEGSVGSDSEEEDNGPGQTATLKVDDWATFRTDSETAQLALHLRIKWHSLLSKKLRSNRPLTMMEESVINTIVQVLNSEEHALKLSQPTGIGRRPHLAGLGPDLQASGRNDMCDIASPDNLGSFGGNDPAHRLRNNNSPNKNHFERFNGNVKTLEENLSSLAVSLGSVELQRANCAASFRYFMIKAGQLKNLDLSIAHRVWSFLPVTQDRIVKAYKGGNTVILIFSIQGTNIFQGYARLAGDSPVAPELCLPEMMTHQLNPPLPVEWIKRANIPHHAARHLHNAYNDYAKVQMGRDGQEIEPTAGEALCRLWEMPAWSTSGGQYGRGPRLGGRPSPSGPNFNNYA